MGTVDNSTSSRTYTSSETVFGGASNDVLGNESVGGFGSCLLYTSVVPWGTLTIEETKAPDGYKIEDSTVSVNGQVLSNRIYFTRVSDKDGEQPSKVVTDFTVSDPAKKYGIQVWKVDKELDKSEAIGGKDHKLSLIHI